MRVGIDKQTASTYISDSINNIDFLPGAGHKVQGTGKSGISFK